MNETDRPDDTFGFDHLPLKDLSMEQHIAAAVSFFRKAMQMDPSEGLMEAQDLHRQTLAQCPLSDDDREAIIERASKIVMEKESN